MRSTSTSLILAMSRKSHVMIHLMFSLNIDDVDVYMLLAQTNYAWTLTISDNSAEVAASDFEPTGLVVYIIWTSLH